MPVLFISNMPPMIMRETLEKFTDDLMDVTANSVKELNIKKEEVSCLIFNNDSFDIDRLSKEEQSDEMVISLEFLLDEPYRCAERRRELGNNITALVHSYFPKLSKFECLVEPYRPKKRAVK